VPYLIKQPWCRKDVQDQMNPYSDIWHFGQKVQWW